MVVIDGKTHNNSLLYIITKYLDREGYTLDQFHRDITDLESGMKGYLGIAVELYRAIRGYLKEYLFIDLQEKRGD